MTKIVLLAGNIPAEFGQLVSMNVLLLDNNKLMGTFWQRRYGCLVAYQSSGVIQCIQCDAGRKYSQ